MNSIATLVFLKVVWTMIHRFENSWQPIFTSRLLNSNHKGKHIGSPQRIDLMQENKVEGVQKI